MAAPKGNQYAKGCTTNGVPKAISSPEELYDWFKDYKVDTKMNPKLVHDFVGKDATEIWREKEVPLTLEGFSVYIFKHGGPGFYGVHNYFTNYQGRYEDFVQVCAQIRAEIRDDQIKGGMAGIYNPSITQRLNGLVEKKEVTQVQEQPLFGDEPPAKKK